MKRLIASAVWTMLLACCSVLPTLSFAQAVENKQAVLGQAQRAYYNLRREGLESFQCSITPSWEVLLQKERERDPESVARAIKILDQLHFTVELAADDRVKITHNELSGQNQQMMDALKQVYGGMEQMTSGFFDTWKLFVLNAPFPEVTSKYQLETKGPKYQLTYKEDAANVVTTMNKQLVISDVKVTTPAFDSTIKPGFTGTAKGFLMNSYDASYQSSKPEEAAQIKVSMDYAAVDGLEMLNKLNLAGTYGGSSFAIELTFSDCKVTKKQ